MESILEDDTLAGRLAFAQRRERGLEKLNAALANELLAISRGEVDSLPLKSSLVAELEAEFKSDVTVAATPLPPSVPTAGEAPVKQLVSLMAGDLVRLRHECRGANITRKSATRSQSSRRLRNSYFNSATIYCGSHVFFCCFMCQAGAFSGSVLGDTTTRALEIDLDDGGGHGSRITDGVFRLCSRLNYRLSSF